MSENDILINSWALRNPYAVSSYRVDRLKNGNLLLEWRYRDPALVDHRYHAGEHQTFTKDQFRKAHGKEAGAKKLLSAFEMDYKSFRESVRTVEVGTNLYIATRDKILQAVVRGDVVNKEQYDEVFDINDIPRAARTPEMQNLGVFNRAAGGARGNIMESTARELIQKMSLGYVTGANDVVSLNFTFHQPHLKEDRVQAMNEEKERKGVIRRGLTWNVTYEEIALRHLQIKGLTETLWSKTKSGYDPILPNRVITHSPATGEVAIDTISLVILDNVDSKQLVIRDGETDIDGHILDRLWVMREPQMLYKALREGTMRFTPPLEKIISHTPEILATIRRFPEIMRLHL